MKTYGMIDIGSNNVRLVIYEMKNKHDFLIALNTKESIRLRNYVHNNLLTVEGINKLLTCLHDFKKLITSHYNVDQLILFATQTIRMVDNKESILQLVKEQLDWDIEILSEQEEALLGYEGMNLYLAHQQDGIYVDLGGGSMEIVYFKDNEIQHYHSFSFGSIVLRNMLKDPIPSKMELKMLKRFILNEYHTLDWLTSLEVPLIVVGGSSRNLVRIDRFITKKHEITHGYTLSFREIKRIRKLLMLLTIDEIEKIEGFTSNRSDVIIPSIYAFELLYQYINASSYICSRTGLREGVLNRMIGD
jgi:exopolyphosphatase/guanosine-5'-triphosphate,3'-diphosphate pyrophosphatase